VSQQQSSEALVNTLIGGAGGIGSKSQLDFDIDAGASKLDVQTSNTRDIFKDIDDTLIPTNSFISSILNSGRDLYVPEFQRKYSWDAENHDEFWSSILDIFTHLNEAPLNSGQLNLNPGGSDERLEEYYFGTLYIAEATNQKTDDEIYEVIDGQQRLATLFILLNEINHLLGEYEEQIGESDEYDGKLKDGVDYFRTGVIKQVLYKNPINEGNADFLRLKLTDHDDVYFKILFDNEIGTVLDRLDSLKDGGPPDWRTIRNIVDEDLNRGAELDDVQLENLDGKDNHDSLNELLSQAKYRADPHELLLDARIEYKQRLKSLLDENLELDGESYKKRAIALINLSILILSSFRVVECKFREPVDDTLKINVFQSLNETGTSLDFHDKIRARVVAKFEIGSDEAENFDNLVQEFGEKAKKSKIT
jgi:uncharacterized protein with ParB-like and HNH nuclease domain